MTETPPPPRTPTSRAGKTLAGAYLDKTDLFILQELCLRLGRERGQRMTMQEFALLAFTEKCAAPRRQADRQELNPVPFQKFGNRLVK